ncbi:guanosine-5'-triphosphate,3'-diphosphate pyrophosphatase [Glaciecola sp. 2405UD65-10]|uniref:Ppx/GppA phosphatase family protein n=1 Tax=Glaciecola sp. 2405UD65-10 TaxID=3397244 RepID=UPI003B5A8CC9
MLGETSKIPDLGAVSIQDEYYAAIDLGSNSFHMVIIRVLAGSVQIVSKNKHKVRLAAGLNDDNLLSQEAIDRGLACIRNFAEKLQDIPFDNVKIVATATLRLATNAEEFVEPAQSILNHKIHVISGEEEARQIYLGVAYTSANQGNTLVIDIGGASTEVILGRDLQAVHLNSFNMGCVTYMERYFQDGELSSDNFDAAYQAAKATIAEHIDTFLCFDWQQCLGASGTPQAVTQILVKQGINDAIRLRYLYDLREQCITQKHVSRLEIDGLPAARQAIFPSGLAILIALFESLHIHNMQVAGGALREGIIYGMLENYQKSDRRTQGLNQLISRFHIDPSQSQRAQKLALELCQQMCSQANICDYDTHSLTSAAAALHELGLHIGYKQYHEHGAYILNHVEITGFTSLQRMMIRDLVLLHRSPIDNAALSNYSDELKAMLICCLRVLRITIILVSRRKDAAIPKIQLAIDNDQWTLHLAQDIKIKHPLIYTELVHECYLQHRAGWKLALK